MKYTIFYSWQSDLPNKTNRGLLEAVIEKSFPDIEIDNDFELYPSIDKDTKDTPGSPDITSTIMEKIKKCDAFVADISIVVNKQDGVLRPCPNPNVLLELGYAIGLLGWEKILLFFNTSFGTFQELPFDIRNRRIINYKLGAHDSASEVKKILINIFKSRLTELLQIGKSNSIEKKPNLTPSWNFWNKFHPNESDKGEITDIITLNKIKKISSIINDVKNNIKTISSINKNKNPN